jgi:hypothetical protein
MLLCFHTYVACALFLDVVYGCNGFQVCFRCVFQVFQVSLNACCNHFFGCFKSRLGVASLFLPPSAASSLPEPARCPYERGIGAMDAGRGSSVWTNTAFGAGWAQRALLTVINYHYKPSTKHIKRIKI